MARRHWLLLTFWIGLVLLVVIGGLARTQDKSLIGMPFLISPFVAIATVVRLRTRKEPEQWQRGWKLAQRLACGGLVALAVGGLFGSASQIVVVAGTSRMQNGPIALFFLLVLFASWPALVRPSPRGTAIPSLVVHVGWLPLWMANMAYAMPEVSVKWQHALVGIGILGSLALSAVAAIVAIAGFSGAPTTVPEARLRDDE